MSSPPSRSNPASASPIPSSGMPSAPGAEQLPERVADVPADRPGDLHREQGETEEQPRDQGGQRPHPASPAAVTGGEHRCRRRGHTGTAASVTRRSWKVGRTG